MTTKKYKKKVESKSLDLLGFFKGKREDNNEWIYGDLIHSDSCFNKLLIRSTKTIDRQSHTVVPETVGQYIVDDDNEQKIFYNDIIKISRNVWIAGKPVREESIVLVDEEIVGRLLIRKHSWTDNVIEKLGNKFDNPELLQEVKNKDE